ncbi:hypothetical protein [Dysgonomonas sp. 25]|uniref:hypothetical protein n=1 Tax=Dysgonomonas sp. 25 TaxID=2302933 RepID=UPI0013D5A9A3|nr:hypothetical protein [Dysgonomonas sp. 25]NDV70112.1 hypothetical protein [Dysgonomonas sp. 25]
MKTKILILAVVCMAYCSSVVAQSVTKDAVPVFQKKECIINDDKTQEPKLKKIFTTDAEGKRTEMVVYQWDRKSKDWTLYEKTEYKYNTDGKLTQLVRSEWDKIYSSWINERIQNINPS